jgi:hypothetical protein
VYNNMPPAHFDMIVLAGSTNMRGFIPLPPGSDKPTLSVDYTYHPNAPRIRFKQEEGLRTCLFSSFASCLTFLAGQDLTLKEVASKIFNAAVASTKLINPWLFLLTMITEQMPWLRPSKLQRGHDILQSATENIMIVSLHGYDGKVDHAVTIVNGWIFDSNFDRALCFNKANLDLCCSSDDIRCEFIEINRGYRFFERQKKGKPNRLTMTTV